MKNVIFLLLILSAFQNAIGQCNCYTIENMDILTDPQRVVEITYRNSCDSSGTAYLNSWLINIQTNDTIARNENFGIFVPLNDTRAFELYTNITALPPINTLRVSLGHYITDIMCDNIPFIATLGVEKIENKTTIVDLFPNPFSSVGIFIISGDVSKSQNLSLVIRNIEGKEVHRIDALSSNEISIDCSTFFHGIYFYQLADQHGSLATGKFIIQ